MPGRRFPALLLLGSVAACSGDSRPDTLPRERFVAANVALRAIPDTAVGADSLRAAALKKAGVTAPQLRAWVRSHREETELVADVWREIADSLQKRDSVVLARAAAAAPEPPLDAPVVPPPDPPGGMIDGDPLEGPPPPPPAPVRVEPPRPMTKKLEVRGQMPIEPDSGAVPPR